jgi:hypothetical protein
VLMIDQRCAGKPRSKKPGSGSERIRGINDVRSESQCLSCGGGCIDDVIDLTHHVRRAGRNLMNLDARMWA